LPFYNCFGLTDIHTRKTLKTQVAGAKHKEFFMLLSGSLSLA